MIKARLLGRRTTGFLSVSPKSGSPLQGITNQKLNFRTFLQDRILFCLFWEVEQFCSTGMHEAFHSSAPRWALKATEVYDVPRHLALLRSEGLAQHLPTGSSSPAAAAATVHFCLARLLVAPRGFPNQYKYKNMGWRTWISVVMLLTLMFSFYDMRWSWSLLYFWYLDKYFYLSS